jgi:ATP/maltotriose-dependent transcriptional regulator MalT
MPLSCPAQNSGPAAAEDLLRRPRLIEKLDRPQALSLVIAPAGVGQLDEAGR